MARRPLATVNVGSAKRWKLWICDNPECRDHSECDPGERCEVCEQGVVRKVQVVEASASEAAISAAYDSRPDTHEHIAKVRGLLLSVVADLLDRAHTHDKSKLQEPELSVFDEFTPKLRETTYGSKEYQECLAAMGEGLAHHYRVNPHHPEFWANGLADMSLMDLIEMLCDWKAATLRHADGDVRASVEQNQARFGYSDELKGIFHHTLDRL